MKIFLFHQIISIIHHIFKDARSEQWPNFQLTAALQTQFAREPSSPPLPPPPHIVTDDSGEEFHAD